MSFTERFNTAAQNAILRKIEADQWEQLPWLAKLIQQAVRDGVGASVVTEGAVSVLEPEDWIEQACQSLKAAAESIGVSPEALKAVAATESAENPQPIGGVVEVADMRDKPDEFFESNSFGHVDGYDWRIIVADRMKNHDNSWAIHFSRAPTQEEFEQHFKHFHARTHHVHVNRWIDGDWSTVTEDYVPHWNKEKPAETFTTTEEWEEGKNWRIKFWDQRVGRMNYVYFDRKPAGITMAKYHSAKCHAVAEARPEGV